MENGDSARYEEHTSSVSSTHVTVMSPHMAAMYHVPSLRVQRLVPSWLNFPVARLNPKYTTVLLHVLIWGVLFSVPHFILANGNTSPGALPESFFVLTNLYHIGIFYLNAFFLYPLFFNRRRWWAFILSIAAVIAGSYYLKLSLLSQWYPNLSYNKWTDRILFFPPIPFLVVGTIYRVIVDKIAVDKKRKEAEAEQLAIKLKFLRSQISPHFIFNVLTNLVSLARKKSEQLEPLLIKLSGLMRYILYESDEQKVALSKELAYLESYIELQRLRFGEDVAITLDVKLPGIEVHKNIEPMLLIPFVENAFKHGIGVDEPFIAINIYSQSGFLNFDVKNKFNRDAPESKDISSGIGLENVQSRLALLYPGEHSLTIKTENELFDVHLTVKLK